MFGKNTVTGTPTAFNRTPDGDLIVSLRDAGGTISLMVSGDLADQTELILFNRRRERRAVTLTLEFDPDTGWISGFSVIS